MWTIKSRKRREELVLELELLPSAGLHVLHEYMYSVCMCVCVCVSMGGKPERIESVVAARASSIMQACL